MSLIVVQRGHVPRKTGATGAPGEQAFAIEAANRVAARVRALGHQVRIIDADVSNASYRGDMFVALHYDSSSNPSVRGASVGYQTPEGQQFAHAWKRHYEANGWSGGFRGDNYTSALAGYYGVRRAVSVGNRRAFILEAGFHSNPGDALLLRSPTGPDRVAMAVAAAVVDILGAKCVPAPKPAPPPAPAVPPFPGTTRYGSRGDAVRAVQLRLRARGWRIGVDGVFGSETDRVVRSFQAEKRLAVDGIVGPVTWRTLWTAPIT